MYKNIKIERVSETNIIVRGDSERFGQQEIVYQGISKEAVWKWLEKNAPSYALKHTTKSGKHTYRYISLRSQQPKNTKYTYAIGVEDRCLYTYNVFNNSFTHVTASKTPKFAENLY